MSGMTQGNKARPDVIVLGAGMVGVSAALHLQARGRDVVLVDRHGAAGRETSFGNAGLIERASYFPYVFPRDAETVLRTILGRNPAARIVWPDLPWTIRFIARYFAESAPDRALANARATWPLIERSLAEHESLAEAAGATGLLRHDGWIKTFRSEKTLAAGVADAQRVRAFGMTVDVLDAKALAQLEPHVSGPIGALHFRDPVACVDPGGLAEAYAALFRTRGGRMLVGDARTLTEAADGWRVTTEASEIAASSALVAMGPWSDDVFRPLGFSMPLAVKRGYHMHYGTRGNAVLGHPVLDADEGYLLAPMNAGIRLTTGAEFARRDRPPTPVQIAQCEPVAKQFFPLGERRDAAPWLGRRPCLPDLLPVIGPAPGRRGLWFDFGHQHHGFTLGPVTGRLIAEMITGETPFTDPRPYRADRF
jgi:D-amino-acid dehydrogenase